MFEGTLLFVLGLLAFQGNDDRHLPASGWNDNEWASGFYERWYGGQLRAMNEPPLTGSNGLHGHKWRYRMLVLPAFNPGYAYRIDKHANGSATLRWVRLNGRGGYAPGVIAEESSRRLKPYERGRLTAAIRAASLGALSREDESEGEKSNPDGTSSFIICPDATHVVFEMLDNRGYRLVARHCTFEEPLRKLMQLTHRLRTDTETID